MQKDEAWRSGGQSGILKGNGRQDNNWSMAKRQAEGEAGTQQEPRLKAEAGRALETVEIKRLEKMEVEDGWGVRG